MTAKRVLMHDNQWRRAYAAYTQDFGHNVAASTRLEIRTGAIHVMYARERAAEGHTHEVTFSESHLTRLCGDGDGWDAMVSSGYTTAEEVATLRGT